MVRNASSSEPRVAHTPTYVLAKLAGPSAFDRPKSPNLTVLHSSRNTAWNENDSVEKKI